MLPGSSEIAQGGSVGQSSEGFCPSDHAAFAGRPGCAFHCRTSGLCASQEPSFLPACSGGKLRPAHSRLQCPPQGHHRALVAEPQAPAHGTAPPYPPQSTRQALLRAPTVAHSTACTAFPRKPLPPAISSVTALNSLCIPAALSPPKAELLPLGRRRVKKP